MGVVAEMCNKVAIMYAGEIVEYGTLEQIYNHTAHPYTKGLFGSIPNLIDDMDRLKPIPGLMPDPTNLPKGCKFHPRCSCKKEVCEQICPDVVDLGEGHLVKCLLYSAAEKETKDE